MSDYYVECDCCHKKYIYESSPMIKDELWEKISNEHWEGDEWVSELFCRPCIERKLGRKLTLEDLGSYASSYHDQEFVRRFL